MSRQYKHDYDTEGKILSDGEMSKGKVRYLFDTAFETNIHSTRLLSYDCISFVLSFLRNKLF